MNPARRNLPRGPRKYALEPWWRVDAQARKIEEIETTEGFTEALRNDGGCLLVSSRQSGLALLLSAHANGCAATAIRMPGAMGAAVDGDALAVGTAVGVFAVGLAEGTVRGHAVLPGIAEISSIVRLPKACASLLAPDNLRATSTFVHDA